MTPEQENELVEAHHQGDPTAARELLEAYQRRIYTICYRMVRHREDALELTQDSLIKVLEGLNSFDGRSKLSTWVIRVTMNCCLSHLRREKVRKHASLDDLRRSGEDHGEGRGAQFRQTTELSGERRVQQQEVRQALVRGLASIDHDMRAVLVLRDVQDLDYKQISEVLGVAIGTVKSRLFRARAALRAAVELEMDRVGHRGGTDGNKA